MEPGESDEVESVSEGEEAGFAYGIPFIRDVPRTVRAVAQRQARLLPEIEGATWLGRVRDELCAVRAGEVLCWSRESGLAAKPVAALAGAVELAGSCALLPDGRVACWESLAGNAAVEPTMVAGLNDVAQVASGRGVTCARRKDASVWCWGSNDLGGLGDGGHWWWHDTPVDAALR